MRFRLPYLHKQLRAAVAVVALFLGWGWGAHFALDADELETSIDNNQPVKNPGGHAATFSTQGFVDLTGEYFQAQGTNGRSCVSCHIAAEAWSINPGTLQRLQPARRQQPEHGGLLDGRGTPGCVQHAAEPRRVPQGWGVPG
jgi:hypothetical protein